MSPYRLLLKLLAKPHKHTLFSMIATGILTAVLVTGLPRLNDPIMTTALLAMISVAISSVTLNEIFLGLNNRKRDMAVLLAIGIRKHLLGIILLAKSITCASLSCLFGAALGYLLLMYTGGGTALTLHSLVVLSVVAILGPGLVAGAYGVLYSSRLNVSEVLRH